MNILVLVHHFPPDVNSTGLLMEALFREMVNSGDQVQVLTTFPHYEGFRVWHEHRGRLLEHSNHEGIRVTRVYSYTSGRKSMRARLLNYLTFNLAALLAGLIDRKSYDLVFCTNGSFFSGLTGFMLSRAKRARCVYNLQDLYPEVPATQGQLRSQWAISVLSWIERFMYRKSDRLTVITPGFRENLISKGVPSAKIAVIPNFVDTDRVRPLPKNNEFAQRHGLVRKFLITHAGNVGYVYDLHSLIEAAKLLEDEEDIAVLIVGDGVAKDSLQRKASDLKVKNVSFLPFQPKDQIPWLRASSDLQVALYRPGAARYSMPSKVYEIMASGRPVLASAEQGSDLHRLIEDIGCGICIEPADVHALRDAILWLRSDNALRRAMGAAGRTRAEVHFSKAAVFSQYKNLFTDLSMSGRRMRPRPQGGHE